MMTFDVQPSLSPAGNPASDRQILVGIVAFNILFRFLLLRINTGEYTDGVLQIIQFGQRDSFWPPLYTAAIWLLRCVGMDGIPAGRVLSCMASVVLIWPLWSLANAWAGRRAALFTLVLYTVSPMALRWSLRVMTDMPFLAFFHGACAMWLLWKARRDETKSAAPLGGIVVLSVAATLTRYQGLLALPLVAEGLWWALRNRARGRGWAVAAQALWLSLPAWLMYQRFGHWQQIVERQSNLGVGETVLNYWYVFEMFLAFAPYFLTLPVFCFFVYGVVRGASRTDDRVSSSRIAIRPMLLYVSLTVLVVQSAFQSFQSRYLLPLLPLVLTCAGAGMARAEAILTERGKWPRRGMLAMVGLTVVWSFGFAMAVAMLQHDAFGDIYRAGAFLKAMRLPTTTHIYTNESYKPQLNGVKLAYASGHSAEIIPELRQSAPGGPLPAPMPVGSILALHSAYGGPEKQRYLFGMLAQRYVLTPIPNGVFESWLVPLLPDIMEDPGTHQNPLAWMLRYRKQSFRTDLYRVEGYRPTAPH
jgi:hypothetical protein